MMFPRAMPALAEAFSQAAKGRAEENNVTD
jgi:hypothetical protein